MLFLIGFIASILVGCGTEPKATTTQIKWGHLDYAPNALLLQIPPDGAVGVCGPFADEVSEAIRVCGGVINRADRINIRGDCQHAKYIKTEAWTQAAICKVFNLPANCNIVGFAGGNQLVLRQDFPRNNNLVLHEVGHFWGMCDQYRGNTRDGWIASCSKEHRSNKRHAESIMGAATTGRTKLTDDDIAGIKAMAVRTDIPANRLWQAAQN